MCMGIRTRICNCCRGYAIFGILSGLLCFVLGSFGLFLVGLSFLCLGVRWRCGVFILVGDSLYHIQEYSE